MRHTARIAAVVATQRAVALVKHLVGTAMRAVTFPVAVCTEQHRRKAPAVQQNQALLATLNALGHSGQQWLRKHGFPGLLCHIHHAHTGQLTRTNTAGHVQTLVTPDGGLTGMPALQRRVALPRITLAPQWCPRQMARSRAE